MSTGLSANLLRWNAQISKNRWSRILALSTMLVGLAELAFWLSVRAFGVLVRKAAFGRFLSTRLFEVLPWTLSKTYYWYQGRHNSLPYSIVGNFIRSNFWYKCSIRFSSKYEECDYKSHWIHNLISFAMSSLCSMWVRARLSSSLVHINFSHWQLEPCWHRSAYTEYLYQQNTAQVNNCVTTV